MGGVLLLAGYLICGIILMDGLFAGRNRLIRLWLGVCAGFGLMMWLPTIFAFFIDFTKTAQILGLLLAAMLSGASFLFNRKKTRLKQWTDMPLWLPLALILPMALLGGYLQYTHILRNVDGALHVGQSTYGDLCLHLGIATGLRNASYPPDYTLLPGTMLGYPFLADSMVTSMLLFGTDLSFAFILTGTLMMALVFTGFVIFCWELCHSAPATVIAFVLMFFNGGLGFLYALDGIWKDSTAFRAIFTEFYATPTNQPELNLRWVNVVCDMMVPQRTLLTGWMMLLPALWLLTTGMRERNMRAFWVLGIWAGAMPMVHTHSFLALGLLSAGAMVYSIAYAPEGARWPALRRFLIYGGIAVILALPQLITWSFPQTVGGGSLGLRFNWVNNQGDGRLIDGYCWFWIKNVGLIWLLMIPAALACRKGSLSRGLACGALCIYVIAELIQFQPNEYDNNKLFYVAYMVMMPLMGLYLCNIWRYLKGIRGRGLLACAFITVSTLSGVLTMGREVVSDYQLFSAEEVKAAQFIEDNLPDDAVFLTGQQHNNAVTALTGRDIVCGTPSYLYFHGVDYSQQQQDERLMLELPADYGNLFEQYGVDYVYVSSYERRNFTVDEVWFAENGELVYESFEVRIYAISSEAKAEAGALT